MKLRLKRLARILLFRVCIEKYMCKMKNKIKRQQPHKPTLDWTQKTWNALLRAFLLSLPLCILEKLLLITFARPPFTRFLEPV